MVSEARLSLRPLALSLLLLRDFLVGSSQDARFLRSLRAFCISASRSSGDAAVCALSLRWARRTLPLRCSAWLPDLGLPPDSPLTTLPAGDPREVGVPAPSDA